MINLIISERSKLAQNNIRLDTTERVGLFLGNCVKFDHTNECCMQNLESIQKNETYKLPRDFAIQTNHLISFRRPELVIVNDKENYQKVDFAIQANHRRKLTEGKKWNKYLNLAGELNKLWNMKVTAISVVIGVLGTVTKRLVQDSEIRWRQDIIQTTLLSISQNTEKSPGDLSRLAVTQIPAKIHELSLI